MSFWLEDDDENNNFALTQDTAATSKSHTTTTAAVKQDDEFTCPQCGSNNFYYQEDSGAQVCSQCFTQSQVIKNDEIEIENVLDLAARTHGGTVKGYGGARRFTKSSRNLDPVGYRKWLLYEYKGNKNHGGNYNDTLVTLPTLEECIKAYKTILRKSYESMFYILRRNNPDIFTEADLDYGMKTIQSLFGNYIQSWSDGAEYYGRLYPTLRFSLRDQFLYIQQIEAVHKQLSYNFSKQQLSGSDETIAKLEYKNEAEDGNILQLDSSSSDEGEVDNASSSDIDSIVSDDGDSISSVASNTEPTTPFDGIDNSTPVKNADGSDIADSTVKFELGAISRLGSTNSAASDGAGLNVTNNLSATVTAVAASEKLNSYSTRRQRFWLNTIFKRKTREKRVDSIGCKDIALSLRPSMSLVVCFLYLTVARRGIMLSQIMTWIKTNEIPILNAFNLIPKKLQKRMKVIEHNYTLWTKRDWKFYYSDAQLLAVACRIRNEHDFAAHTPGLQRSIDDMGESNPGESKLPTPLVKFCLINARSIPFTLAQICADLRLPKAVFRTTLILLGVEQPLLKSKIKRLQYFHNPPLEGVQNTCHYVAIVFCACVLQPQWRSWKIVMPKRTGDGKIGSGSALPDTGIIKIEEAGVGTERIQSNSVKSSNTSMNNSEASGSDSVTLNSHDSVSLNSHNSSGSSSFEKFHGRHKSSNQEKTERQVTDGRWISVNESCSRMTMNDVQVDDALEFWEELFDKDFDREVDKHRNITTLALPFINEIRRSIAASKAVAYIDDRTRKRKAVELDKHVEADEKRPTLANQSAVTTLAKLGSARGFNNRRCLDLGFMGRLRANFVAGMPVNGKVQRLRKSLRLDCSQVLLLEFLSAAHHVQASHVNFTLQTMLN